MLRELAPDAIIAILETSGYPIPRGNVHFPLGGLRPAFAGQGAMWRGYVEYAPGLRFDIWARVDVRVTAYQVVPMQPIPAGALIEPGMVRLEQAATYPGTTLFAARIEDVMGRQARRLLRPGLPIPASALDKHPDIRKGDTLQLKVNAGSATIGLDATALSPAATGDAISVRVNETGRTVRARITGPGQAVVQLSGAN
jgi:flagella basal body P-ring formation protein FlgA